jgi:AraC-like DNA-binding protein
MVWLTLVSLLVLVVMVYYNWSSNRNVIFLGLLLSFISIYALAHYWLVIDFNATLSAILFNHFTPAYLLVGPLLYFYVRGVLADDFIWKNTDWFHIAPALIQLIAISPYLFTVSFSEKITLVQELTQNSDEVLSMRFNMFFSTLQNSLFRFLSVIIYWVISFRLILQFLFKSRSSISYNLQRSVVIRWLLYLHISFLILNTLYAVFLYRFDAELDFLNTQASYTLQTAIAFFIIVNNLSLLLFPELLFGIIRTRSLKSLNVITSDLSLSLDENETQENVLPFKNHDYFLELGNRLKDYMEEGRPYLSKSFNLSEASRSLNVPQHHLTLCIREIFDDNFSGFRNSYRIRDAQSILKDPSNATKTIDAIADETGFSSRTSFYKAFDRITGISPNEFRA